MIILDGRRLADKILKRLKKEIEKKNLKLKLAVVLINNDLNSLIFVKQKEKACKRIGIDFQLFKFSSRISESRLKEKIKEINNNPSISGIIVQLPLPNKFNVDNILDLISSQKDVEKISPVVRAIEYFLKEYKISLKKKKVVLIGGGRLVGEPVARWLESKKINFQKLFIKNKKTFIDADIIISGVGKKNLIKKEMVKRGVTIIDVGGDVDFQSVSLRAKYISPVPGGVGPLTVACVLENLVRLNG